MIRSGSFIFLDGIKKDETWGSCKSGEEDEVSVKKTIAVMSILFLVITGSRLSGFTVVAKQPEEVNEGRETLTDDKPDDVDNTMILDDSEEESTDKECVVEEEKELFETVETIVPIYNYEIDNVIVPTTYAMSLNPYEMPIVVDKDHVSTEQVVTRNYGIINKSSTDKVVTITFTVEDLNGDKITFVDSEEEAKSSDPDDYAVYLSVIPADGGEIRIGDTDANVDTHSSALSDVEMTEAKEQAVALHAGENCISFRLSKAIYEFEDMVPVSGEKPEGRAKEVLNLMGLNPDGKSVTAFTFGGAMNPKAEWEKLLKGIKITASYEYRTADGSEKMMNGTGAMMSSD